MGTVELDAEMYGDMFELAPVALWLEDFSALKLLFTQWRAEGVTDLRAHLRERPELVALCSQRIRVLRVNQRALTTHGARDQRELIDNLHLLFRDDMLVGYVEELAQLWDGHLRIQNQTINYTLAGNRRAMRLNANVLPGHEESWSRVLVALDDVTDRDRTEREARSLFEHSPVSLWVVSLGAVGALIDAARGGRATALPELLAADPSLADRCLRAMEVIDVNWRTLSLLGASDKATLLAQLHTVFGNGMRAAFPDLLADLDRGELLHERELLTHALDGRDVHVVLQVSVLPAGDHPWERVLLSMTDITARKEAEAALAHLSTHDALTGLRNRAVFSRELAQLDAERRGGASVLLLDVNGLKGVNDRHGHPAGDALLRTAAQLIAQQVDATVTACRIGGDEFALLVPDGGAERCQQIVRRLDAAFASNDDDPLQPSLSVGAATAAPGEPLEAVVHRADADMYEAKHQFYALRGWDRRTR